MSNDLRRLGGEKFGDAGNAMADDVLEETTGEPANPVLLVAEERFGVAARFTQLIAIVTFHVHRDAAKISVCDQIAHPPRGVTKLIVVSDCDLQVLCFRKLNNLLRLGSIE